MNFLLRNTLKNMSIKTSSIQSQRKYEYFLNILDKMNKDFEIKMDIKECDALNSNSKKKEIRKIKEWETL